MSLRFSTFLCSISLHFISALAEGSSSVNSNEGTKAASKKSSSNAIGAKVVIICLGLVSIVGFSIFLFKIWQKKKREEQHTRLLKLFEDDDELEVELGFRD